MPVDPGERIEEGKKVWERIKSITYAEASDLIGRWYRRQAEPLLGAMTTPLDFGRDGELEALLLELSDDLDRDLAGTDLMLLALLKARVSFVAALAATTPDESVIDAPAKYDDRLILRELIRGPFRNTKVPAEWRDGQRGRSLP